MSALSEATTIIAVFGGSGATGRVVITELLGAGFEVRALCRSISSLSERSGQTIIEGSLSDTHTIEQTVAGTMAALILFGPRPPYTDIFCANATASIVAALKAAGVPRLICQTGGMIGDYPENRTWPMRMMTAAFNHRFPTLAADRAKQERIVTGSGLQWTILKPPRLTDGPAAPLEMGTDIRVGMLSSVSRNSIANWIVRELVSPEHIGECLFCVPLRGQMATL